MKPVLPPPSRSQALSLPPSLAPVAAPQQPSEGGFFEVGTLVFARYHGGGDDYLAQVEAVYAAFADASAPMLYSLMYHDGDHEEGVPPENVRAAPLVGSRVEGRFGGGDEWFPGTISDVSSR